VLVAACSNRSPVPTTPVAFASPGPLATSHATAVCDDCHVENTPAIAADKCLGCHDHVVLWMNIHAGRGFHASRAVVGKPCEACHREHRGVRADVSGWDRIGGMVRFDHRLADWPLDGAHARVACSACHAKRFAGTDPLCGACHADQPHAKLRRALQACDRCHSTQAWRPPLARLRFDHDARADAAMPLIGQHAGVACIECHPDGRFALALSDPSACDNCHASPHANEIASALACKTCHSPKFASLHDAAFDHDANTRFVLGVAHRGLACARCHTPALGTAPPSPGCESCHTSGPHGKRFDALGTPPPCGRCHSSMSASPAQPNDPPPVWRADHFDHASFRLRGKHAAIACRACHRGKSPADFERFASGECMACHAHAKVHTDAQHPNGRWTSAQCTSCHL
jgi:hypothetical protein